MLVRINKKQQQSIKMCVCVVWVCATTTTTSSLFETTSSVVKFVDFARASLYIDELQAYRGWWKRNRILSATEEEEEAKQLNKCISLAERNAFTWAMQVGWGFSLVLRESHNCVAVVVVVMLATIAALSNSSGWIRSLILSFSPARFHIKVRCTFLLFNSGGSARRSFNFGSKFSLNFYFRHTTNSRSEFELDSNSEDSDWAHFDYETNLKAGTQTDWETESAQKKLFALLKS